MLAGTHHSAGHPRRLKSRASLRSSITVIKWLGRQVPEVLYEAVVDEYLRVHLESLEQHPAAESPPVVPAQQRPRSELIECPLVSEKLISTRRFLQYPAHLTDGPYEREAIGYQRGAHSLVQIVNHVVAGEPALVQVGLGGSLNEQLLG